MLRKVILGIVAAVVLVGAENLIAREKSGKPQGKQKQQGQANGMKLTYSRPATGDTVAHGLVPLNARLALKDGWLIKSSTQVKEDGEVISTDKFIPDGWYPTSVPSTVLNALVKNGVYPDPRIGLNNFLIPDASDEFNEKHDLARYSHLPEKRNPWKDPYWYRTEFSLPETSKGKHIWLNFKAINYRADVWLNGKKIANKKEMVGAFFRFRFDITDYVRIGENNYLAVKIYQVDHPSIPDTQLDVFGGTRALWGKEIRKDVTLVMFIGYDCMPTVRDRNMGIWQEVYIAFTGAVDIRNPFVVTDLPLPKTSPAYLTISAELVNATMFPQKGILRGTIIEDGVTFFKNVELGPGETREIVFSPDEYPQLVINSPRLWWPRNYGEQNLYNLSLCFEINREVSDEKNVTFGIRKVTKELYELSGSHGLRLYINGKKIFCRGGWLQPEILLDMNKKRVDTEVRYLTEANLNTVTFHDIPMPPDGFLDACDKHGLMFWNCFYASGWVMKANHPLDHELLSRCTVDIIKRFRNHPSLVLYSAMAEFYANEDVYERWRKNIIELDKTRLFIPTMDVERCHVDENKLEWMKKDIPTGVNDAVAARWKEPSEYYEKVREGGACMFNTEIPFSPSLPPIDSLRKFIPDLGETKKGAPYPLNEIWAHHGANGYYKYYDSAIRRIYGSPKSVADYCMKAHLRTANQHRAICEATNHRMWDITSGAWEWKVNSCWPSVHWQIYDWYLKPMVSFYYYKLAYEPLHVQLSPLDSMVTVVNNYLEPKENLYVRAEVYDFDMKLRWSSSVKVDIEANRYKDVFIIPNLLNLTPVYFVKLELKDSDDNLVSSNFYWLSSKTPADLTGLQKLPPAKLNISYEIENKGQEAIAHVKVENPTDKLAFFIHLAVTKGPNGEEVLPVFWEDNYFSLLPKESRQVSATFAVEDLDRTAPVVEAGGWNIQGKFECTSLKVSKAQVKSGEPFTVTATIKNTFIDGSRIELYVDNKVVDSKLLWARARAEREISFTLKLLEPGLHEIKVGTLTTSILVN